MTSLSDLRAPTLSAVKWNFVGQAGRQGLSFVVSILLARLVAPSEFGLLAMLLIFQEIANALVNSGLNAPLIQAPEVSKDDLSTVFHFNVGVGALCYAAMVAGAPFIAGFYAQPRLEGIVALYGMVFLIHAFGNVQQALLLRELNYRRLNLVSLVGVATSGLLALSLAFRGAGVYSLLAQQISYAVISTGLFWFTSPWRPSLRFSPASFRRLFGFGSSVLVVSLLDKIMGTVDELIVGRLYGSAFLGQYSRGKTTRDLPVTHIQGIFASLAFPIFSRIPDKGDLCEAQGRFIGMVSYVTAPLMVGMFLLAEPFIVVVYSEAWRPAVPFLRLFALFGVAIPLSAVLVHTIMSRGEHDRFLRLELLKKAILAACIAAGAATGPVGLVLALGLGHYLGLLASLHAVADMLGTTSGELARSAVPGVGLSLLMAVPVYLALRLPWPGDVSTLLACTAVGMVTYWVLSVATSSREYLYLKGLVAERLGRGAS